MLQNYLKIAVRNLKKHRFFNTINILGLSLAIAISVLLFSTALREFSYDQFHVNKEELYQLYFKTNRLEGVEFDTPMACPVVPALKEALPEIKASCRWANGVAEIEINDKKHRYNLRYVDEEFFSMFSFPIIKGNQEHPLKELNSVVINEKVAATVFGEADPIGQILRCDLNGKQTELLVTAVAKQTPSTSSLDFNLLTRFENDVYYKDMVDNWDNFYHDAYIQLAPEVDKKAFQQKLLAFTEKNMGERIEMLEKGGAQRDGNGGIMSLMIYPFKDLHFAPELGNFNSINKIYPYALFTIGVFVLLIACINFINLTISTSLRRSLEVGLRKVMGATRSQLIGQFLGESLLIILCALFIALMTIQWSLPEYNAFFKNDITLYNSLLISSLGMVLLLIVLGGGIYPAFLIAKFQPASVLKGNTKIQKPGLLRNILVIAQFALAVLLISNTLIIKEQLSFIQKKPLGFNKEQVISVPLQTQKDTRKIADLFRKELAAYPEILKVSSTYRNFGSGKDGSISNSQMTMTDKDGKELSTHWHGVDYDFFQTMDMEIVEGKAFEKARAKDTIQTVMINETLAKRLGEDGKVGGFLGGGNNYEIIGIVKDFHFQSLDKAIEPVTMVINEDFSPNYLLVKIVPTDLPHSMAIIERTFSEILPGQTFLGSLLDENTNRQYQRETKLSQVFIAVSIFAIFLSCLGLLGIAIMTIVQRTKEVGIRKVLGASTFNLVSLLSKDFLKLVLMATIIGLPLSWYGMSLWLQEYHYRTELHWWIFALAGFISLTIALITISFQTFRAALANPIDSIKIE